MSAQSREPGTRRAVGRVVGIAVAVLLGYLAVVVLYASNDRVVELAACSEGPSTEAVEVSVTPQSVDAVSDRIAALLVVEEWGPLESSSGTRTEPVTIVVSSTDGAPTFRIGPDQLPSPRTVKFVTTGEVERWPFDTHAVDFTVLAVAGATTSSRVVPLRLCGSAHVPGWTFSSAEVTSSEEIVFDGQPVTVVRLTASRSTATVAFGIVILALLAVLPVLALTVAILAFRGSRKVEATLTSWMAAMLFAVVPLRSFLPGSPPIGSWVDYLVVLWVVVGLVAALVVYVSAWVRWAPAGGRRAAD